MHGFCYHLQLFEQINCIYASVESLAGCWLNEISILPWQLEYRRLKSRSINLREFIFIKEDVVILVRKPQGQTLLRKSQL